jgi:hypothetical protein
LSFYRFANHERSHLNAERCREPKPVDVTGRLSRRDDRLDDAGE